jgi:hypothetical protein
MEFRKFEEVARSHLYPHFFPPDAAGLCTMTTLKYETNLCDWRQMRWRNNFCTLIVPLTLAELRAANVMEAAHQTSLQECG